MCIISHAVLQIKRIYPLNVYHANCHSHSNKLTASFALPRLMCLQKQDSIAHKEFREN